MQLMFLTLGFGLTLRNVLSACFATTVIREPTRVPRFSVAFVYRQCGVCLHRNSWPEQVLTNCRPRAPFSVTSRRVSCCCGYIQAWLPNFKLLPPWLRRDVRTTSAVCSGDIDRFDDFIADDYVNHNPYVKQGLRGAKEFFKGWMLSFPDTEVTVEDVFADGDTLIGRFTYRATHKEEFLGIPATGRSIQMRSIDIWRVRDGKFVERWDELNLLEVMQQLGMIPANGRSAEGI